MRRSHHGATAPSCTTDESGHTHIRHHVSRDSGLYRSRTVLSMERRENRLKKREERRSAQSADSDEKRTTEQAVVGP